MLSSIPENKQPLEFYLSLLCLGSIWDHAWCRDYTISRLSVHPDLYLLKRVNLALKFQVSKWIKPAFRDLCHVPLLSLMQEDVALLGSDFFLQVGFNSEEAGL